MSQLILLFLINKFVDSVNEETKSNFPYRSMFLKIKDDLKQVSNWISNDPSILSEVKTEGPSVLSKAKTEDPSALSKVKTDDPSALSKVKTDDPSALSKVKTDDPSALSEEKTNDTSAHKVNADDLRESMYSLDEILRECLMLSKKRKQRGKICMNLYSPHELCTLRKFNERLQTIKKDLHGIRSKIPPRQGDSIHGGAPDRKEKLLQWTSSAIDETKIYGWKDEVVEINKELIKEDTALNKVGIVGMFGSGKSTLAQKIFVSEEVLDTFPLRLWVWVSPQCTEEELVRRMLDNLGVEEEEIEETLKIDPTKNKLGVLLFILYLQLLDKRYLIVFDDVRNLNGWYCNLQDEPPEDKEWDRLAHGLPKGNGSAIIITSRKEDDARKMVGKGNIYTPKPLIGDDGWTLFQSAFEEEVNTLTAEDAKTLTVEWLKELKQEITIKCGGLPLALITAGKEMVHEKLEIERKNVRMEMSQYDKPKDKVQDGAEAEKQKDKATVRDGEQADKQKPEDTVIGEGSGHAVRDGAQAGKQKAEDDHISEEGSSHADRDGAQAQKQNVEEGVAEESSRQTVRDRAQAEKKKEEVEKKKAEDAVAEDSSGPTVRDRAQAEEKKEEAEKKKAEDAVAEEGSGHAVHDGAQAEKQKAEEGSSHAVHDGAQAEKQKADEAVEEGSDHDG